MQVPMAVALYVFDSLTLEPEHRAGLCARGNLDWRLPLEGGNINFRTQGSMNETDGNLAKQIVAIALKNLVRFDMHDHVKVSGRRAAQTGFAIAGGAQA